MIVSFGTVDIKMAEFNSYEELEEALAQCENGSIFAGAEEGDGKRLEYDCGNG